MSNNPQLVFLKFLRHERSLIACDEVSHYGCIADILAIDKNKEIIIEYEFKASSNDLKIAEKKKSKYQLQKRGYKNGCHIYGTVYKMPQTPHKFYFVVSEELYHKEQEYLNKVDGGVIMYFKTHTGSLDFVTKKKCYAKKANLQKYKVALLNIACRATNAYVCKLQQ